MGLRGYLGVVLACIGLAPAVQAEGNPGNGQTLATKWNCARCHGQDGNARSTSFQVVPMLAGQPAAYLVKEMVNYADGTRQDLSRNESMSKSLRELGPQDLEDLAAYYESQKRY